MEARKTERRAMLQLLTCSLLWSISGIMIKWIPWSAPVIAGARSLLAGIVIWVYMRVSGCRFKLDRTSIANGIVMSGMFMCFIMSNKLTTAANAIVIQSSAPVFVLLYNVVFRHKKARVIDTAAVLLTMLGITFFFLDRMAPGRMLGNALALLAGVLLASTYIINSGASQESCMSGILIAHGLTALIGLPMAFIFETPLTLGTVGGIALLGVVQLGIPYVLFGLAVRHCPPLATSLICITEAVFNPIWVFLFSGEAPSALALFGGALVLLTVAGWAMLSQRRAHSGGL